MGGYQREPEHCMAFDSIVTNGIIVCNILLLGIVLFLEWFCKCNDFILKLAQPDSSPNARSLSLTMQISEMQG
jgi:hypothetical protein